MSSKRMVLKPNNSDIKSRQIKVLDKKANISKKVKEFDEFVREFLNSKKLSDTGALNNKNHKLLIFNYDKGFFSKNLNNKNKQQNFS
ncbi:MAG: hypothetical protein RR599_04520 [Victivallaceae bacterium]